MHQMSKNQVSRIRNNLNSVFFELFSTWVWYPPIPKDKQIRFFERDRADFYYLSNFYPSPFVLDGELWPQVESYYQSQKSLNPNYRNEIRKKPYASWSKYVGDSRVDSPYIAKKSWFRKHPDDLRQDWSEIKVRIMEKAVASKFEQNPYLKKALMRTGDALLIEDSTKDEFWGIGNGNGRNILGRILMDYRKEVQSKVRN